MNKHKMKVADLKLHPDNPRTINKSKFAQLKNSLQEFPEMLAIRPLVINAKNEVLGGNMRLSALIELGVVEVDVVKVTLTPEKEKEFVIKDNLSYGEWDYEIIEASWGNLDLEDWGFDLSEAQESDEDKYTRLIKSPQYEPKKDKPKATELLDVFKSNELIAEIEANDLLSDLEKDFLVKAAHRHTVFDYAKIADFYAHSSELVQKFMEDSTLVIVDFEDAIKLGHVRISENMMDYFQDEHD